MSLVGNYFNPHLLLNHGMLVANGAAAAAAAAGAGPASYFASDRSPLGKPSVLSNFSLPSAFSPPKYIGISLDQVSWVRGIPLGSIMEEGSEQRLPDPMSW